MNNKSKKNALKKLKRKDSAVGLDLDDKELAELHGGFLAKPISNTVSVGGPGWDPPTLPPIPGWPGF